MFFGTMINLSAATRSARADSANPEQPHPRRLVALGWLACLATILAAVILSRFF